MVSTQANYVSLASAISRQQDSLVWCGHRGFTVLWTIHVTLNELNGRSRELKAKQSSSGSSLTCHLQPASFVRISSALLHHRNLPQGVDLDTGVCSFLCSGTVSQHTQSLTYQLSLHSNCHPNWFISLTLPPSTLPPHTLLSRPPQGAVLHPFSHIPYQSSHTCSHCFQYRKDWMTSHFFESWKSLKPNTLDGSRLKGTNFGFSYCLYYWEAPWKHEVFTHSCICWQDQGHGPWSSWRSKSCWMTGGSSPRTHLLNSPEGRMNCWVSSVLDCLPGIWTQACGLNTDCCAAPQRHNTSDSIFIRCT